MAANDHWGEVCPEMLVFDKLALHVNREAGNWTIFVYIFCCQVELYVKLIALRNDISHQMEMHTYMIFSNKSLLDMAKYRCDG